MRAPIERLYPVKRWMYRGGRPRRLARALNRISALQFSAGLLSPQRWMTLEVAGRRSGRRISVPVVVADLGGERYLVSMLGEDAQWVRNVRAAGGRAVLRRGGREQVRLEEVEPAARAPILRRYLQLAPGARPHLPVQRRAPLAQFERIAPAYPVFRIKAVEPQHGTRRTNALPPVLGRRVNAVVEWLAARGLTPANTVSLEVAGRRTGLPRRTAVVLARHEGRDYVVSLGGHAQWVRNLRAAEGRAVLRHGAARTVRLTEVAPAERAPILHAFLQRRALTRSPTRSARFYFGLPAQPTVEQLVPLVDRYPVFEIRSVDGQGRGPE
jgi:deazaflavin-dependent oxidoreductase (nitroreductase family)